MTSMLRIHFINPDLFQTKVYCYSHSTYQQCQ